MNTEDRTTGSRALRWLENFIGSGGGEPESKDELVELLRQARNRALFDSEALSMMEGVLEVSDLRVRDIMIPRAQMVCVGRDDSLEDILPVVVSSAHSRFPVIGDDRAEVVQHYALFSAVSFSAAAGGRIRVAHVVGSRPWSARRGH